ncbi:MAG: ATPase [Lachnospiraceae bacterium]|nr:ATPase [Lachnospiraceae bacterium]
MIKKDIIHDIEAAKTSLGIELGSTRIKACLLDSKNTIIASGEHAWENRLENGIWTYHLDDINEGLQACYKSLKDDVKNKYNLVLKNIGSIGISAMMHGYLALDENAKLLTAFRTWRNTITEEAADKLTKLFDFNIPQRWSIAHLYQAILNKEEHVGKIKYLTTLAAYIHFMLTDEFVIGIGDASGMFPIDSEKKDYNQKMLDSFDELIADKGYAWKLKDILPKVLVAGNKAGKLSIKGAKLLDPLGDLSAGALFAPPEGDAGTGMVATNAVKAGSGNVSAGTSDFAMIVVDKELKVHKEIDMVTTPDGLPVAMVHCNNCTSDINAWASLFFEFAKEMGMNLDMGDVYIKLFGIALKGDKSSKGLLSYNYYSGEGVTDLNEGRPLLLRKPDADFNLANFMRNNLMSALATLKIGMDILTKEEKVIIGKLCAHGGFFKTPNVGAKILAAAVDTEVVTYEAAGEGGAYGMALLAAYSSNAENIDLAEYLDKRVFANVKTQSVKPDKEDVEGFNKYIVGYKNAIGVEKEAIKSF